MNDAVVVPELVSEPVLQAEPVAELAAEPDLVPEPLVDLVIESEPEPVEVVEPVIDVIAQEPVEDEAEAEHITQPAPLGLPEFKELAPLPAVSEATRVATVGGGMDLRWVNDDDIDAESQALAYMTQGEPPPPTPEQHATAADAMLSW